MPYGVGLKDERPTSNIERLTLNEKTNIQYRKFNGYFCFFKAQQEKGRKKNRDFSEL